MQEACGRDKVQSNMDNTHELGQNLFIAYNDVGQRATLSAAESIGNWQLCVEPQWYWPHPTENQGVSLWPCLHKHDGQTYFSEKGEKKKKKK